MWPMASEGSLTEGEHLVLQLHPHWKTLLRPILILILVVAAALALLIPLPARPDTGIARAAIGAVAAVVIMIWFTVPLLRWRTTSYELTNRPAAAAARHPVQVGPRLPADQDQRRLVLARPDRPAARLRQARRGIRGRARPARPERDPPRGKGAGHALPASRGRAGAAGPR